MTRLHTFWLFGLTIIYLFFELRFNAELLETVGGAVNAANVEALENHGRVLTGCAVSLFVLQIILGKFTVMDGRKWLLTIFLCSLSAGLIVIGLQTLSETLVDHATAEFRSSALASTQLKKALVEGNFKIDGVPDPTSSLASGQGRAFLTLMPLVAACSDFTSERVKKAVPEINSRNAEKKLGSVSIVYQKYAAVVKEVEKGFDAYQGMSISEGIPTDTTVAEERAWQDYLSRLAQKGETPYTISRSRWPRVITEVQKKVPVPDSWDITDERTFKEAVRSVAQVKIQTKAGIYSNLPTGLSWEEFFLHPMIQSEIQAKLGVGRHFKIFPSYESQQEFERQFYKPLLKLTADRLSDPHKKPDRAWSEDQSLKELGDQVASIAIIPPLAITFSLLGALSHMAKLVYLTVRLFIGKQREKDSFFMSWMPLIAFSFCLFGLAYFVSHHETSLTMSQTYRNVIKNASNGPNDIACYGVQPRVVQGIIVGQSFLYPISKIFSISST